MAASRKKHNTAAYRTNGAAAYDVGYTRYTYGNTAPARKSAQKPKRRPKPQKQVRAKLTVAPLAVAGMLLAGLMLLLVICGYVQLYEATNEVGQLQDEIATLQEKNDRLHSTYDEKVDLNTVESEAAKLGMHKPNSKQSIELNLSGQDKAEIMTTEKENILQTAWKAITGTAKKMIEYFR